VHLGHTGIVDVMSMQVLPTDNDTALIQQLGNNITFLIQSLLLSQPQNGVFL
jgi:hypothetical protein